MTRPIIPAVLPEDAVPSAVPSPHSPEWLNSLNEAERQSPEAKELFRHFHESGGIHVTWLIWPYQPKSELWIPPLALLRQGSMFFLDCGRGPFAVTAGHVYEQYLEDTQTSHDKDAQAANVALNLTERLIARGKYLNLDIATFRVSSEEIARMGKRPVSEIDGPWPAPPNPGEAVYIGGFPACERDRIAGKDFSFGLHSAIVQLTSFTDHQLCCQFDRTHWLDVRGIGLPPVGYEHGGMSGGPMLQPIFKDGAWDWRLSGIISEAVSVQDFERVTAVRAHFILPDGQLR